MYIIPNDVIALFADEDKVLVYNVFTRHSLALPAGSLADLQAIARDEAEANKKYEAWKTHSFTNETGLLSDPTRIIRDSAQWQHCPDLSLSDFVRLLADNFIIVADYENYKNRFQHKKGILDFENFGNFHEQLGQHLLAVLRKDPEDWWYNQKFTENFSGIKNNLYKSIQEVALEKMFNECMGPGKRVLDVGCGVGYYSKMVARTGADVIAIDPNKKYIDLANESAPDNLKFICSEIGDKSITGVEEGWADIVFMSDALLFYFIKAAPNQKADLKILIDDIKRLLKTNGRFISFEPHGTFFLAPWLGSEERPFTVLTEYNEKKYGITNACPQLLKPFLDSGFALIKLEDIYPDQFGLEFDKRAHYFASEFPLWQSREFIKL